MNKELTKAIKEGNTAYFYNSRTWRSKRIQIVNRDGNECMKCKNEGRVTVGTKDNPLHVHHIKHLRHRVDLALVDSNLITLCHSCHEEEHPEKEIGKLKSKRFMNEERWE